MRAVVITGVSRGLGAALFDVCSARGDRILAIGRHFTPEQQQLRDERPGDVTLFSTDVADAHWLPDHDTLRAFLRDSDEAVLLHNAAVVEPIGAVGRLSTEAITQAIAVNLTAPVVLTNSFLRAAPGGARLRVLFISSGAAHRIIDGWSLYCTTKAAGETFFEAVASQVAGDERVTVASVDPGQMDTGMQDNIRRAAASGTYFPGQQRWIDAHAEGRLADPMTVAERIIKEHAP
ncbi:SDR family NAD(P)-dependent oxidoreductase [Dactylosporangium aurantiacum]|uniref:SDR family NAD(P)-dependent oxidoreductase n=1 Tax=Dactylosporangium aurantiacum TaxID=35754 RepID=A0A9Q9ME89_9ACTN|nr:SDR family NAD(P)-dependent oxidoreductase [Dactylosporangium aurantiacum]MDG6106056.1 SDR family NAD(P)-dependent oxidoreductase [Dactylosporangium aurantiacum]UWZ55898.1 SDR family NAD(P)-dependent oxidoreductase [Dactylosporangium aurantiacum]